MCFICENKYFCLPHVGGTGTVSAGDLPVTTYWDCADYNVDQSVQVIYVYKENYSLQSCYKHRGQKVKKNI